MPPPAPTDRSDKPQAILAAATATFLAHGFSAATTDMIQRAAGVSKATLYAAFPNKEALFAAVIERECETMARTVCALQTAPGDIGRTLSELGRAYLDIVLSPTGLALFRVAVAESPRFPHLGRLFWLAGPKTIATLVSTRLAEAARAGAIDVQAVGVEAAAGLFVSLLRGEGQLECLMHPEARPSAAQVDQWVRVAVTTFLGAFGARAAALPPPLPNPAAP